jgi:hypothetical protein
MSRLVLLTMQPPNNQYMAEGLLKRTKWPKYKANYSSSCSAVVKKSGSFTAVPLHIYKAKVFREAFPVITCGSSLRHYAKQLKGQSGYTHLKQLYNVL